MLRYCGERPSLERRAAESVLPLPLPLPLSRFRSRSRSLAPAPAPHASAVCVLCVMCDAPSVLCTLHYLVWHRVVRNAPLGLGLGLFLDGGPLRPPLHEDTGCRWRKAHHPHAACSAPLIPTALLWCIEPRLSTIRFCSTQIGASPPPPPLPSTAAKRRTPVGHSVMSQPPCTTGTSALPTHWICSSLDRIKRPIETTPAVHVLSVLSFL
jgi:hypothetical protein